MCPLMGVEEILSAAEGPSKASRARASATRLADWRQEDDGAGGLGWPTGPARPHSVGPDGCRKVPGRFFSIFAYFIFF